MSLATIQTFQSYAVGVKGAYTTNSKFAALHDSADVEWDENGGTLNVGIVTPATSSEYNPNSGFISNDNTGSFTLQAITPIADRQFVVQTDAMKELQAHRAGHKYRIGAIADQTMRESIAPEVDVIAASTIFSKTPASNILTTGSSGADVSNNGILDVFNTIEEKAQESNYFGRIATFITPAVMKAVKVALANQAGAMAFIERVKERPIRTGAEDYIARYGAKDALRKFGTYANDLELESVLASVPGMTASYTIYEYGALDLIVVPSERMKSKVKLLTGVDNGQTAGGWVPDVGARQIQLMAVPYGAAFVDVAYYTERFVVPYIKEFLPSESELAAFNNRILNKNIYLRATVVDPLADKFTFQTRYLPVADVFAPRANSITIIADEPDDV